MSIDRNYIFDFLIRGFGLPAAEAHHPAKTGPSPPRQLRAGLWAPRANHAKSERSPFPTKLLPPSWPCESAPESLHWQSFFPAPPRVASLSMGNDQFSFLIGTRSVSAPTHCPGLFVCWKNSLVKFV